MSPDRESWSLRAGRTAAALVVLGAALGPIACGEEVTLPESGAIAFSARPDAPDAYGWQLFVADPDWSRAHRLTFVDGDTSPSWSPDGEQLAYDSSPASCDLLACSQISVIAADGTGARTLTPRDERSEGPVWSPDGVHIAYVAWNRIASNRGLETGIYVVGADGSAAVRVSDAPGTDTWPVWSPDGTQLAFWSDRDDRTDEGLGEIYIVDADGTHERRLTDTPGDEWGVDWSPDGKELVVSSDRGGNHELVVLNVQDGTERRLTHTREDEGEPLWSPDGEHIGFTRSVGYSLGSVVVLDLHDGTEHVLSPPGVVDSVKAWSPDGSRLAFTRGGLGDETLYWVAMEGGQAHRVAGPYTDASLGVDWGPARVGG